MLVKNDQPNYQGEGKFTPFDIWEKGGLTEHLGGIYATRRLLTRCHLTAGQQILDVGCGTGFTACYLVLLCHFAVAFNCSGFCEGLVAKGST